MNTVTIHEAKTNLSKLIQRALEGEDIIISKGNRPVVQLKAIPQTKNERILGKYEGGLLYMAPDFNETPADFEEYTR
jgi:antitoxin (DNA-binding transcriptional repressor) of toxin-antitoxin stability system